MALMSRPTHDPRLTRWWWRTLREWIYELIDPLWAAFRGDNTDDIALANVTEINGVTSSELGVLDGLAATTAELNKLAGLTAEAAELNKADRTEADGVAEASRNVVPDANKDILGKRYDINQSLLDGIAGQPCMRFDGGNDYVSVPTGGAGSPLVISEKLTILALIKALPSGNSRIVSARSSSGSNQYDFIIADDVLRFDRYPPSGGGVSGSIQVNDGEWHAVAVVMDEPDSKVTFYVDGVSQEKTYTEIYSGSVPSTLYIGKHYDDTAFFKGNIALVMIFNRALTADEVKAFSSGAAPEYADVGASQTDLVTNGEDWTGASGTTPPNNWSDTGSGTSTYLVRDNTPLANFGDNKALELSASGGSKTLYQAVAQANKRYRISFVYRNLDGSSSSYVALGSSSNNVTLQNSGISGDGILFEQELLANGTDLKFFVDSGGTLQIDHVKVVQIGCVAAYLPDAITHAQWQDAGGNELHGSVSGAVPLNLPSNHVARYIKPGITGDTTLVDAVPAGYRIKSMVADVTGAGSGMILNVGTSAGGTDVVNGQDISANGLFDLTVAKHIFSLTSAQTLYVNDDGGTAWSGVSVDLYIEMERVR